MTHAQSHMSRELLTVEPSEKLQEVVRQMAGRDVGAALVMEGGRLAGIVTERDVLRALAGDIDGQAPVGDCMTRDPETVEADESIEHAATLMIHGGFRHLPVVEGDDVVGMLSIRDLVRVALVDSAPRGV
jgi:CBS domain-containing protein